MADEADDSRWSSEASPGRADAEPAPSPATRHWVLVASVALVVVALDQLTKWWALQALTERTIDVVWTLRFNLVFNSGAAFSVLSGGRWGPWLAVGAFAIVGYLVWQGRSMASRWGALAIGLILGGAVGNLVDRVFRGNQGLFSGRVVDFIDLQWWPVFNVADMAVVVGGVLLVLVTLVGGGTEEGA